MLCSNRVLIFFFSRSHWKGDLRWGRSHVVLTEETGTKFQVFQGVLSPRTNIGEFPVTVCNEGVDQPQDNSAHCLLARRRPAIEYLPAEK